MNVPTVLSHYTQRWGEGMRLLIVEDEQDLSTALANGFRQQGYTVDLAFDGEEACALAEVNEYDLMILDLNLPGLDGLEVCRRLRTNLRSLLILMLTARNQPEDRITGLDLGADDYVLKPFHFGELAARVRALLRRDMRVREPILQCGQLKLDPAARIVWKGHRQLELTRREFAVLEYLMRRQGETVSQEELLEHVWGAEADPFTNTVRVHMYSLRRKLGGDSDAPQYIETVVGQGYRLGARSTGEENAND